MPSNEPLDTAKFVESLSSIDKSSIASDLERRRVIFALQDLLARIQSPREKTTQLLTVNSYVVATIKTLVNLDVFGLWARDGGQPKTIDQLGQLTGADPNLLERLFRLLIASGLLSIDAEQRYVFGDFANGLTAGRLSHSYMLHSLITTNTMVAFPKFFAENKYRNPTDSTNSPFHHHMGTSFMDYLLANLEIYSHLNEVMKTKNIDTYPWFLTYPLEEMMEGCSSDGVILVDIGGGTGSDISTLLQHLGPRIKPGQLVLQDLPSVINEATDLPPAIEKQSHGFFDVQPVKAARAYYLHNVLHDWSAEECQKILGHLRVAMKPGYSRLLINETIMSRSSSPTACAVDLSMMTVNAGAERTSAQWHQLLSDSGFKINQMYLSPAIDEGLIDAEPY